ncbi:putative endonuclease [Flagellimonas meridianipacifica]|uniref:Putative endonuclease n=2 Tax=Flagellimonas meridianipacifica TaxID=1080225 RepID=A0A2T0MGU1_9FLAO|nr:putative endonuclease [Allomuricauda pacifica]
MVLTKSELYREVPTPNMKKSYVYMLRCSDNTYYTGVTSNLEKRIQEHQEGKHRKSYTFFRRPVVLVFYAEFNDISLAIEKEKQIKKWSRIKKEALINNTYEALPNLSRKKFH